MTSPTTGPTKRTRDPEGRRSAILDAARSAFSERGYRSTTIREIARRAGVTHGLVMLHFASKELLFLEAVPGTRDLMTAVAGDLETLPERIAAAFVDRMETADGADPFMALVRSAAGDQQAAKTLLLAMHETSVTSYHTVLDKPDVDARVAMLGAHLIGITFSRYVLRQGPLATMPRDEVVMRLGSALRTILLN